MKRRLNRGMSIIELAIVLAILAIAMARGMPLYSQYMADLAIRSAAESALSALQLAKSEAARGNRPVEFVLAPNTTTDWGVRLATSPVTATFIDQRAAANARDVQRTSLNARSTVTFDGFGAVRANLDGSGSITALRFTSISRPATSRALCVTVSNIGTVRMCDPNVSPPDSRSCGAPVPAGC